MSDTEYNVHKQLAEELAFLWHAERYIQDAEKDGNQKAADVFRRIKDEDQRHAQMLKEVLQNMGQASPQQQQQQQQQQSRQQQR